MAEGRRGPRKTGESIAPREPDSAVLRKVAHGIAHGMNNVLATVMGLASVLETELPEGSAPAEDVRAILEASRHGLDLTRSLLDLAQGGEPHSVPVDLNELTEAVASFLRPSISEKIHIETRLATELPYIIGEAGQLRHAIVSLAMNATEAMSGEGTLTFSTKTVTLTADKLGDDPCEPGDYVRLQVGDTGSGMDQDALKRAFDPFFSTKSAAASAGLGLPIVYGTVRAHNGRVTLYSKPGLGTTVTVDLPMADPKVVSSKPPRREEPDRSGQAVLLVDDDPLVLRSSGRLLGKLGYEVLKASSGQEAIDTYVQAADRISFVLLDLVMPEMDGREVIKRLRRIDPEARVVICTGYGGTESIKDLMEGGALASIDKPFTLGQLRKIIDPIE